ncbi:MAG: metal (Ni/Fe) hydrogenase large subunit [Leptospiraceae bacterium]|nr:metal (Ni/Fe) hydrogenase large subunit [Leptospiraceae bacterium]
MPKSLQYNAHTGIFRLERTGDYYSFIQTATSVKMEKANTFKLEDNLRNSSYPLAVLRHSFGKEKGEIEDYALSPDYHKASDRDRELSVALNSDNTLKNLDYRGLNIPIGKNSYYHVVGPIHAGVIEPGHFRFYVTGEMIQFLHIRLGFQRRGINELMRNRTALQAMPLAESIATDSTISYSTAFADIFEQAAGIKVTDETKLLRMVLLEIERVAIHIGDMGAMAGDIGYYPLLGVCSTDRGIPLGVMESLVGSRFGKGSIFPGEVRLNRDFTKQDLIQLAENLKGAFSRIEKQILRAFKSSTIRERLHDCGTLSRNQVFRNGFIGMAARCTGISQDLRLSEELYIKTGMTLWLEEHREELVGDAWARFYLRYAELKNSCEWLIKILPTLDIPKVSKGSFIIQKKKKFKPGVYYSSIEGWRGPVLVALDISAEGKILQSYIRDSSVLNWHALELAVREELIGDFPLNNKSFNLSYLGVDL